MAAPLTKGSNGAPELLQWVGSKRRLLSRLLPEIRFGLARGGRYYEPFLGSAVVFLRLRAEVEIPPLGAMLSDKSRDLISFYRALSEDPRGVNSRLAMLRQLPVTEATFATVRDAYNAARQDPRESWSAKQAARFLYINRAGYNGLWRTNQSGDCNVPFGAKDGKLAFPSERMMVQAGHYLARALLATGDFEVELDDAEIGDTIYADPPYDGTFDGYSGGFDDQDQLRLARTLYRAAERGAYIIASNLDTPRIRELYAWASIKRLPLRHTAGGGARHTIAAEALITRGEPPSLPSP